MKTKKKGFSLEMIREKTEKRLTGENGKKRGNGALWTAAAQTLFGLCMAGIIADIIFNNQTAYYEYTPAAMLLCGGAAMAVWLAAWKAWDRVIGTLGVRTERRVVALGMVLYFFVQVVVGLMLQVNATQTWDFGIVFDAARQQAESGIVPGEYFQRFGNNAPLYLVLCGWFELLHALGIHDVMPLSVVMNAALIHVSVWGVYAAARRLSGQKTALFAWGISMLFPVFLLYAPIVYTDTVSMPFVIWGAVAWLKLREREFNKKTVILTILFAVCIAVGTWIKLTVIIVGIAALADAACNHAIPFQAKKALIAAVAFAGVFTALNTATAQSGRLPQPDRNEQIPKLHWVMMGLNGTGGYNDDDYQLTLTGKTYDEKLQIVQKEIIRRLEQGGISGMFSHLADKLSFTFGDGLFMAPVKLDIGPVHLGNPLQSYCIQGMQHTGRTMYFGLSVHLILLIGMALGAYDAVKRQKMNPAVLQIAVLGLIVFLMIWETRSRYLVNFLPLMAVLGVQGYERFTRPKSKAAADSTQEV